MKVLFGGLRYETCKAAELFFQNCVEGSQIDIVTFEGSFIAEKKSDFAASRVTALPKGKKAALEWLYNELSTGGYDLFFSAGFPYVLTPEFFRLPVRFLNSHPHLLPEWPGYDVIRRSFQVGETAYGVTVHHMNEEVDAGETIVKRKVDIETADIGLIYKVLFGLVEPAATYEALSALRKSGFFNG